VTHDTRPVAGFDSIVAIGFLICNWHPEPHDVGT
jgi:hypothetical protein